MTPRRRGHPVAWMIWAASAAGSALLLRHPVYLAVVGLVAATVTLRLQPSPIGGRVARWTAALVLFPAVLNLVLSRSGTTVLLHLPWGWLGGPYTLEAFLFGLTAGVQLAALLAVAGALQIAVEPSDVLRRLPGSLHPVGVAAAIGLSFSARAERALRSVREAQLVRGRPSRGWRDLASWASPLVVLTLENAQDLAEAMVVRGWPDPPRIGWARGLALVGWIVWAGAILLAAFAPQGVLRAAPLGALATAVLLLAGRGASQGNRYRPDVWAARDSLSSGTALGAAGSIVLLAAGAPALLNYSPYPTAVWPDVQIAVALGLGLLALPAWTASRD